MIIGRTVTGLDVRYSDLRIPARKAGLTVASGAARSPALIFRIVADGGAHVFTLTRDEFMYGLADPRRPKEDLMTDTERRRTCPLLPTLLPVPSTTALRMIITSSWQPLTTLGATNS